MIFEQYLYIKLLLQVGQVGNFAEYPAVTTRLDLIVAGRAFNI